MNLQKTIFTNNDCYKEGRTITVKGIMVHSTGANNPFLKRYVAPNDGKLGVNTNNNDWNRSGTGACVHGFIGKLEDGSIATYQVLPWNHRGWHCGRSGNDSYISFEICEDGLSDGTYFGKVYKEAVELCAYLCNMYKLNPMADGVVICHSEGYARGIATNHADVMHWFPKHGKSMDTFRTDVKVTMSGTVSTTSTPSTNASVTTTSGFQASGTATSTGNAVNVRKGPGKDTAVLRQVNIGNRFAIDGQIANGWYHVNVAGIVGYVHQDYVKLDNAPASTPKPPAAVTQKVGTCTGDGVRVRQSASTDATILRQLNKGNLFDILGVEGFWTKVNVAGTVGYVHSDYVG